jgi:hypothetical protein
VFDCDSHVGRVRAGLLAMRTFPSREALTPEWGQRMTEARGHSGQALLFTDEAVVYSPGQFVSNIHGGHGPRYRRFRNTRLPDGSDDVGHGGGADRLIRDPVEAFNERSFIGFGPTQTLVHRLWDVFEDVAIWSSDYPHHDAKDAWDGLHHVAEFNVPVKAQRKLMGESARRHAPAILPW